MYELMEKYSAQNNNNDSTNRDERRRGGILLTQLEEDNRGEIIPGSDDTTITDKKCLRYNKVDYITWNYTLYKESNQDRKRIEMLQQGISFFQKYNTDEVIGKTRIFSDSCSADTVFKNPDLVVSIRTCSTDAELQI